MENDYSQLLEMPEWEGLDLIGADVEGILKETESRIWSMDEGSRFDEGIGSCWVRGFDKNAVSKVFDLPEGLEPVAMLPIGYPDEKGLKVPSWHYDRKDIDAFVEYR